MAVDFSLLPPEEPDPDDPPSRLVWMVVFFVLVLIGVFGVLRLWPGTLSTHTWKFWTGVLLFPVGIPALLVLRRFSHYEARRLDVGLRNEAAREYKANVFAVASLPVALAGSAYRFSAIPAENAVGNVLAGFVRLKTMAPIARDGEPTKARWLEVPGVSLRPGMKEDDHNRQRAAMKWLFTELLNDLTDQLQALPSRLVLHVHLFVSSGLTHRQSAVLWQECWREYPFRHARVVETAESTDLKSLDIWLDHAAKGRFREARLIVAVQLHPLLSVTPPAGVTEAGVALLLVPDALASQYEVPRTANLYRPVSGSFDQAKDALSHALRWANVAAVDISGGWQTGLSATQAGALLEPAIRLGLKVRATDLDQTVGNAGIAAPWLAIACAAGSLCADAPSQIIFAGHAETVDCAVLRQVSSEKAHG